MASAFCVCAGTSLLLAWSLKLRKVRARKVELVGRIEDFLTISDSLNRTQGRRAQKIVMSHASIGEIIRDIPGLDVRPLGASQMLHAVSRSRMQRPAFRWQVLLKKFSRNGAHLSGDPDRI